LRWSGMQKYHRWRPFAWKLASFLGKRSVRVDLNFAFPLFFFYSALAPMIANL
jgi:hypothetical protein